MGLSEPSTGRCPGPRSGAIDDIADFLLREVFSRLPLRCTLAAGPLRYAAGSGADDAALVATARRSHGDHPEAERLVAAAMGDLLEAGVLRRT